MLAFGVDIAEPAAHPDRGEPLGEDRGVVEFRLDHEVRGRWRGFRRTGR